MKFDRDRMVSALTSGDPVRIPKSLNREELREFILNNNKQGGKDMNIQDIQKASDSINIELLLGNSVDIISHHNVATESGWREVGISGMCEACFDNVTFEDWCFWRLDIQIKTIVRDVEHVVLAGGAMRSLVDITDTICDYDLFVTDLAALNPLKQRLVEDGFNLVFECPEGKLFTYKQGDVKVQVINNRPYSDIEDLINSFDITACCAAWDGERVYKHKRFVFDVLNKRLNLNNIEYPKATLNRLMKYSQKGYKLSREANEYFFEVLSDFEWTEDNERFYID